jgi:hypothetical protein
MSGWSVATQFCSHRDPALVRAMDTAFPAR